MLSVASSTVQPMTTAQSGAGLSEAGSGAIVVYGRWSIDVADPDGVAVSHTEIENALTPTGADALAGFLGRTSSVGQWRVVLDSTGGAPSPCPLTGDVGAAGTGCVLAESAVREAATRGRITTTLDDGSVRNLADGPSNTLQTGPNGSSDATGLAVGTGTGADAGKLILAGTLTAAQSGNIGQARTFITSCDPPVALTSPGSLSCITSLSQPAADGSVRIVTQSNQLFTIVTLPQPIPVSAGQIVQVTVAISFS
jgi:hypothetical protein